ncbi:tyrosine--tRNA ligase [Streptomyces sp. DSM 44917]|uniref:Tyrosine--tRNA ligase n=1 Tax=Streptomyces boetiae TaxID=3075541 RepID=A0ABU2LEV4_9ACTN|nr:tyrosine--tRNA ligase [Streptomyces sp. DSM 44917]MDT0310089.1 tyrosine--tRNA ligase [Streptomyces sp. DSM 44917]
MTRLGDSVQRASALLAQDLSSDTTVRRLLEETGARRYLDLSDLEAGEQARLIASRAVEVLPSAERLAERIEAAQAEGHGLHVKLGIDPTAVDVHLGHAVPIIALSRFQRMGHDVTLIIGDITAKIGDPSGRSSERPPLTDEDIARNLAGYRDQVRPFFDFERVRFRHNSEWLGAFPLPRLIGLLSQIPVSSLLQREDFRTRLEAGHGLTMSELIYPVAMAIDSAEIDADVELGGADQLLNMQMGRRVMELYGLRPQLVVTLPLIEGTDGSGAKMSKSKGNYVGLAASAEEVYGRIMSIPDRLMEPYLRAWTEWTDEELALVTGRLAEGSLHPMDLKKVLAGEVVTVLHGLDAAMAAREGFTAQFSRQAFTDVAGLPEVALAEHAGEGIASVLTGVLAFTPSASAARRLAKQNGLRLVLETGAGQRSVVLAEADALRPLGEVVAEQLAAAGGAEEGAADVKGVFLKAGRKLAQVRR